MNPSRFFILRPVATSLLMLGVLLAGLLAYRLLPQAALPQVEYPVLQVQTGYPGASPEVMAVTVTAPLERQFGMIAGLRQMSSTSSGGLSLITLQFDLGMDIDVAVQSVQAAMNAADGYLPPDLPTPPVYSKVNPADAPILTLAVTSATLPLTQVQDLVDSRLVQRLAQVSGVGQVTLAGGQRPAVRIQANPAALAAHGLGFDSIRNAIDSAGSRQAKGNIDGPQQSWTLEANSQLRNADEYRQLVLKTRNGVVLHLGDVATVTDGAEDRSLAAWTDQQPAILVDVRRQPGANAIAVVDDIRRLLPELQAGLPAAAEVRVLNDRTVSIRHALNEARFELVLAVALVVMVIFLFLRSLPATLIPGLATPLSLIGAFAVMYAAGFSLNNLTLMALTIATGFVVDDAIVMIENIARHIEDGETPLQAALKGAREIGFTIIALTVSLIAVLVPLLFMGDVVGRLFREFALTLAIAILISAVVSLTLTPMLCARWLSAKPVQAASPGFFDRLAAGYGVWLNRALDRPRLMPGVALGSIVLSLALAAWMPKGFFPQQDSGLIRAVVEGPAQTSFAAMAERQQQVVGIVLEDPAVDGVTSVLGVDGVNTTINAGRLQIRLKPWPERREPLSEVLSRLQAATAELDEVQLSLLPVQDLTVDDRAGRTRYQYQLESPDPEALQQALPLLVNALRQLPQLTDVAANQPEGGLQARITVDRDSAARLGVTLAAIDEALYNAFGQRPVATIFTPTSQYRVILESRPGFRPGLAALDAVQVTAASGQPVPLSSLARVEEAPARLALARERQFPSVSVAFNPAAGYSLGDAVAAIEQVSAELSLPSSVQGRFQGEALAFREALANQPWLILAAIVTLYIVLGVLYESFIHPLTILSTLPSAGIGAFLALALSHTDLNVIAIIGLILLIGIVQKNAIMMIDFALAAEREQGLRPRQAIHRAGVLRLRPILMTTLAALFSAVPLLLSAGPGSELRQPLGLVMIGGLLCSQALTLFTTPVVYLAFDRLSRRLKQRRSIPVNVTAAADDGLPGETAP